MFLYTLLIIANIVGGFIAASAYIVNKIPSMETFSKKVNPFKLPIGITVFLISFINIFNFWAPHYPKLSLLFGLLTGIVLSIDVLNKIEIDEVVKTKIFNLANKFQIPIGVVSIIVGILGVFTGLVWLTWKITSIIAFIL